jgi:hypothetical protein
MLLFMVAFARRAFSLLRNSEALDELMFAAIALIVVSAASVFPIVARSVRGAVLFGLAAGYVAATGWQSIRPMTPSETQHE